YDEQAGRFIVAMLDVTPQEPDCLLYAFSNDSDPTHGFTEMGSFLFADGLENFADYPRFGWNADAYVFTFNMSAAVVPVLGASLAPNVEVLSIEKPSVLDKDANTFTFHTAERPILQGEGTLTPAVMHGSTAGGPMWFVESGDGTNIKVVKMDNVF